MSISKNLVTKLDDDNDDKSWEYKYLDQSLDESLDVFPLPKQGHPLARLSAPNGSPALLVALLLALTSELTWLKNRPWKSEKNCDLHVFNPYIIFKKTRLEILHKSALDSRWGRRQVQVPASVEVPAAGEDVGSVQESPAPEAKGCHCP